MREKFEKTILSNGQCVITIITPKDIHYLNAEGDSMDESDITPRILHMLSEAYYAGYKEATNDATNVVKGLLHDNKSHRKPKAKIGSCVDYRTTHDPKPSHADNDNETDDNRIE